MPRGTITPTEQPKGYSLTPATLVMATGDPAEGHQFQSTGRETLIVRNSGAGAHTVTVDSVPDPTYAREGDVAAFSVPAGAIVVFQKFPIAGWRQSNGFINVDVDHAELLLGVIRHRD